MCFKKIVFFWIVSGRVYFSVIEDFLDDLLTVFSIKSTCGVAEHSLTIVKD